LHILQLGDRSKEPATARGFHDATSDVATAERLWRARPNANIGLWPGPSGYVVIDVDGPVGRAAAQLLGLLSEPTLVVLTGRAGGVHLYYRHPGFHVSNRPLAPHLDVRADEGYVVLPPSVHPNGTRYRWRGKFADVLDLPPHVVQALQQKNGTELHAPLELPAVIPEGQRNDLLFRRGCAMRRQGFSTAAILAALGVENASRCQPPLEQAELETLCASIARYPAGSEEHP